MAKQNNRKPHVPCVWNCGRWGKSKREPICEECKRRESESGKDHPDRSQGASDFQQTLSGLPVGNSEQS